MATTVPMAPLTRPLSTQRLAVSITRASHARQMMGSKPPASSEEALTALGPLWTALMVAIGWPLARSRWAADHLIPEVERVLYN